MEIRKFIFTIASRFDAKGFKAAEDAGRRLMQTANGVSKAVGQVVKQHQRSGDAAAKAAERSAKAAKKTEQDFLKAVRTAEKALDREEAAAKRAADARAKSAQRAAAAEARAAEKAAKAKKRERDKSIAAEKRANEKALAARKRVNTLILQQDLKAYKQRRALAEREAAQRAASRAERRAGAGQAASDLGGLAGRAAGGVATGLAGLGGLGAAVITTGVSFESLRARLKTVEGSAEKAGVAFKTIQDFTKSTPFELEEVTTAYVRLKSLGLDASKESLTAFGNVAAAQGASITDFIEAVADASTGEFERLKEFGITAKTQGDRVTFMFKGVATEIGKNSEEIQAYLKNIGMTDFAGAMDDQAVTAAGMISNLKDGISTFFDEVSQLGVLDEFKALLTDLSNIGGGEGGLAQMVADVLVTALRSLREIIQSITTEDIQGFLSGAQDAVSALVDAVSWAVNAFREFVEFAGSTEEALTLLTLGVIALQAAFAGPAGLLVAVGAVGVAIGRMVAAAVLDMDELDASIAASTARIQELNASIAQHDRNIEQIYSEIDEMDKERERRNKDREKAQKEDIKKTFGGLGAGLFKEGGDVTEQHFRLRQIRTEDQRKQEQGFQALLTAEGKQVYETVTKAEKKRVEDAEKRARKEAKRAGRDVEAAAKAAREAVSASNEASREKAFKAATEAFAKTGSAEEAAKAAITKTEGKKKKGGKGDTFFDFEEQAKRAARQQGETFAEQELQRLAAEGVTGKEAIAMAQEAGKKRAEELKQRFMEAGRIFDASADNILDILGLRGPGSVLEGRPPPQTLLITIAPVFKFIESFTQTIESVEGAKALTEITGQAGQAAAEQGLAGWEERVKEMFMAMLTLQTERLLKADGGGKMPPGPQG